MTQTLYLVEYDEWVVEGDNHAGWAGYRFKAQTFAELKELNDWLAEIDHLLGDQDASIQLKAIKFCSVDRELPISAVVARARSIAHAKRKAREKKELLDEIKSIKKKLKKL